MCTLADSVKDLRDTEVAFNGVAVDLEQYVSRVNIRPGRGSVRRNGLGHYRIARLDPRTSIVWGKPLSFLRNIEPTNYKQAYREQCNEDESEGNGFPIIRNGY